MAGHPQSTPRGLWAKSAVTVGADGIKFSPYSTTTALLDSDSTGLVTAGGIKLNNKANGRISGNSTGVVATALQLGSTAVSITVNSTGYKIGSRYISTNSTGNLTT